MDVFFSTGEKSGDQVAAAVASALRRAFGQELEMAGLVGPLSAAAGVRNILAGAGRSSAGGELRGFTAWSRKLEAAVKAIRDRPPKLLVALTHPTFNLPLAALTPSGVRRIMIGPPEIWAWRANALGQFVGGCLKALPGKAFSPVRAGYVAAYRGPMALANFEDLLCLTPMNANAYRQLRRTPGNAARIVQIRHPVAGLVRNATCSRRAADLRKRLGLADHEHLLGIFPGSREGEIRLLLPTMLRAACAIAEVRKDIRPVVSVADPALEQSVAACIERSPRQDQARMIRTDWPSNDLLCACCHAILASGTLTLEAALLAVRATVVYTVPSATKLLLRPLFRHQRVNGRKAPFSLPNAMLAWRGVPADQLPYPEATLRRFRAANIVSAVLPALPAGAHGAECPRILSAETTQALREELCPSADAPSADQYVVQAFARESGQVHAT